MTRPTLAILVLCCTAAMGREAHASGSDQLCLTPVADGLERPLFITAAPSDATRVFVLEQYDDDAIGRIRIIENGTLLPDAFLEIGPLAVANSTGLLCLAFAPDYATSGHLFIFYTDATGTVVISRFTVTANPNVADAASEHVLLTVPQPHHFHQGGWLGFGPDGYLYISLGDGGPGGDPDQRGQDSTSLLGKLIRIDVNGDDFPADPVRNYAIPPDNPFVGAPPLDEIWAFGLREVWRASFDRLHGDLYLADVGEDEREEINIQPAAATGGANYGWRCVEGGFEFMNDPECVTATLTPPDYEYDHLTGRCAVIGGYVYRGTAIESLAGRYLFADHCTGEIESFRFENGNTVDFMNHEVAVNGVTVTLGSITSFGEDATDELYIATRTGQVYRIVDHTDCAGPCGCPWDINNNGAVDVGDLLTLLGSWGPCPVSCEADFNSDAQVNVEDLLALLSNWG